MTEPPPRLAGQMATLGRRGAETAAALGGIWIVAAVLPALLLLGLGLTGASPAWTALPGGLLVALYAAGRLLPDGPAHTLCYRAFLLLLVPFAFLHAWRCAGRAPGPADPIASLLGGPLIGRTLSPLGDRLPWDGAATLDLRTGRIFADSAHARLAATDGAPAALRALAGGPGRWLATDGQGLVVLADREGRVLSWRRPRPS